MQSRRARGPEARGLNKVDMHGPPCLQGLTFACLFQISRSSQLLSFYRYHRIPEPEMTILETVSSSLLSLTPDRCVQTLFVLTSCFVLALTVAPAADRKLLLDYGARRSDHVTATKDQKIATNHGAGDSLLQAVKKVTSVGQVPHSWFFTYYAFYILCAGAWAVQYFMDGPHLLKFLARRQVELAPNAPTVAGSQVVMLWIMMFFQAARRLYECFVVMRPSKSTMWFVHWVMGLGYYFGVSLAVWVEGSAAILQGDLPGALTAEARLKAVIALPLFLGGWLMQHRCHKYLAGLKKYSLPESGMFYYLVCPHYTCECLIYFSLAILGAPAGQWCNRTLMSVLSFVIVNLGVTAHGTRTWYIEKFGTEKVVGKWVMLPLVY